MDEHDGGHVSAAADDAAAINEKSAPVTPALAAELSPVASGERIGAIDALRGLALLGIFVMNIITFALPGVAMMNPMKEGGFEGVDRFAWIFNHIIFDMKMMTLFSMLFGAGMIVMSDRAQQRGAPLAATYYRRMGWLFVIGMLHAYLIWFGDILVAYAICGCIIYPMRKLRAGTLIAVGLCFTLVAVPVVIGSGNLFETMRDNAAAAQLAIDAGESITQQQEQWIEEWEGMRGVLDPTAEDLSREREAIKEGGYVDVILHNAEIAQMIQIPAFLMVTLWRATGMMLIGAGLMRAGMLMGTWRKSSYVKLMLLGYGVGLPLVGLSAQWLVAHEFDFIELNKSGFLFNYCGSFFVALGHASALMLLWKLGAAQFILESLAAVGRMALTNYLMQSVLGVLIFWGYGIALWQEYSRAELWLFVIGVWIFQILFSRFWLSAFRFGPAEWAWRSLTYMRTQPMRKQG